MSTLDVVAEVLREAAPRSLKAREIAALAGPRLPTTSRTPQTVVSRDLAVDVRDQGSKSRFLRVDRGAFILKEALSTAFYNDVDAYAAQWTRNLVAAGEIAAGVVDERSIRDLKPADVASYRQCHFFSGIAVWSRALRDAGIPDDANVWTGSCPCQPFSSAGRKGGFSDEQHLWPEWFRLIAACRPTFIVGEQVSSKDGRTWIDLVRSDLESADYAFRVLDIPAACTGAPHGRHRFYFVAYARERGREILGSSWVHDRGQRGHDVTGRSALDAVAEREVVRGAVGAVSSAESSGRLSDSTSSRSRLAQDAGADRSDEDAWASEGPCSRPLEFERGGDADVPGSVSDTECLGGDEGRERGAHGRPPIESDRHGEVDGARVDGSGASKLGDAGLDGAREHGGELLGDEAQHEEWSASGDHASVVASPAYRPGDRVRLVGDPSWGGAVGGFWAEGVEWIYCRPTPGNENGCFRPAEPGTQPLVNGLAVELGRTRAARLRCYGNAIVRPQAVGFLEAVVESFVDALHASSSELVTA